MEITSRFEGEKIIERPIEIGFLKGSFGKEVFDKAGDIAKNKYESKESLLSPVYRDGVVQGSNLFYVILVNEVLRGHSRKLHTATPADIERTLRADDTLGIEGNYYVDTGLVLRSTEDSYSSNNPLARDVTKQLKRKLGDNFKFPIMIPLMGLDLKVDDNKYGLGLIVREDAEIIRAPILNQPGRFNTDNVNVRTGLPNKIRSEGNRGLYTRTDGLSGLAVLSFLSLGAHLYSFGYSGDSGRVVVCGEAADPKNFGTY